MRNTAIEITTETGNSEFYPTPDSLAGKMLAGVDWSFIETVLEPSAGKGDLLKGVIKHSYIYRKHKLDCDCIEIDPYLRQILKFNFSDEADKEIRKRYRELDADYCNRSGGEYKRLKDQINATESAEVRIIHDDFLNFNSYKEYHLIVMNPPFSDGDKHLLKALEIQKDGGKIICLLNAETIRNPYTNTRKLLCRLLNEYNAEIEYLKDEFIHAERRTDVEVAIVRVDIPTPERKSYFFEKMQKAAEEESKVYERNEVTHNDFLQGLIQRYNVEVRASCALIREYEAIKPYITDRIFKDADNFRWPKAILTLTVGTKSNCSQTVNINEYLSRVRAKYWNELSRNNTVKWLIKWLIMILRCITLNP